MKLFFSVGPLVSMALRREHRTRADGTYLHPSCLGDGVSSSISEPSVPITLCNIVSLISYKWVIFYHLSCFFLPVALVTGCSFWDSVGEGGVVALSCFRYRGRTQHQLWSKLQTSFVDTHCWFEDSALLLSWMAFLCLLRFCVCWHGHVIVFPLF